MNRLIVIVILLFISIVLGILLVLPKYEDLSFLQKKIGEKRAELQSQEAYLANLNQVALQLKNYQIPLSKIDSALPDDPQLPALFDYLQKTASQSGLVLKGISVVFITPGREVKETRETPLSLVLSGSYLAFKNFLSTLEKSARLIETESISFASAEEGPFDFNLRIKVYSY